MKLEFSRQIVEKYSDIKFHENPSSRRQIVRCGRMDGLIERMRWSLFAILRMRLKLIQTHSLALQVSRNFFGNLYYRPFGGWLECLKKKGFVAELPIVSWLLNGVIYPGRCGLVLGRYLVQTSLILHSILTEAFCVFIQLPLPRKIIGDCLKSRIASFKMPCSCFSGPIIRRYNLTLTDSVVK
jgi:hypothetical protein